MAKTGELKKHVSIYLPISEWLVLRDESVRRGLPITQLIETWIAPHVAQLKSQPKRLSDVAS